MMMALEANESILNDSLSNDTYSATAPNILTETLETHENCKQLFYDLQNTSDLQNFSGHACYQIWTSMLSAMEDFSGGPPWLVWTIVQILYGVVCLVGLAGNSMVIYVVVRFSKMQTVTNLYILNLAIADELFLIGIPFLVVTAVVGSWPFGKFICQAYFVTTGINQFTSSLFLLVMSADRYLAVCHPINAPKYRTPLIAKIVAITAWTISILLMIPIFIYTDTMDVHNKTNCNIFWPEDLRLMGLDSHSLFTLYSFILAFAIPVSLILAFYILVIFRLRTVGPKRNQYAEGNSLQAQTDRDIKQAQKLSERAKERRKSHRKVTKLVLTVITVYVLCWFPYWATQIGLMFMEPNGNHSNTGVIIFLLAGCLSYSNSAMNPILYAFLSDNFKKSFKKACSCPSNKDFNTTTFNNETSIFPRRKSSSYRRHRNPSAAMTSATFIGTTCPELTNEGTTRSTILHPSLSSLQQSPPVSSMNVSASKLIADIDESDNDSGNPPDILLTTHNDYTAILVQMNVLQGKAGNNSKLTANGKDSLRKTSFSDLVTIASVNDTFVQDNGVIVTAL